jgi:hypothetical protein
MEAGMNESNEQGSGLAVCIGSGAVFAILMVLLIFQPKTVARQSGWEHSDNQDGHFGGRGGRMIVAARR